MNNDAGWCGSGGPWITPELSMQRVVWTETIVQGPKSFQGPLARPQAVGNFYEDIAVLAMPAPEGKARIAEIEGKSSVTPQHFPPQPAKFASLPAGSVIPRNRIVDLTGTMDAGGKLAWDVPEGKWLVLRFGHTSTGVENHPAPTAGLGLECDKLSKAAAEAQFNGLMGRLIAENRLLSGQGKALVATHIDSWETGSQNWTPRMREEFQKRRGYDLLPLLPTFTGRVVDSLAVSERFLWDLRQTVSDMLIENYAGHIRALANRHGLRLSIEAYDGVPCDEMTYAGQADEPMSEFWSWDKFGAAYSCTEMASAAHVYGKRILGAEAFTATDGEKWLGHPAYIKDLGDWAFCEGINRFVFHRYAMQPWTNPNRAPGMSMGPWGLHYERTQTWWDQSRAWHEYLARCQHLLRQGLFVADVCYLQPEGAPRRFAPPPTAMIAPFVRGGYNFDGCTPEVVLTRMSVKDGRIVLPDGMSYRVLVLPQVDTMTPALLGKIKELVEAGATVLGPRPLASPSLSDYPQCDQNVRQLADAIWGDCNGAAVQEHQLGRGRVVWGPTPEKLLAGSGVPPDFTATPRLRCIHRRAGGTDLYFVANPATRSVLATATFRTGGSRPELWWPDSGRIEPAPMFQSRGGVTNVLLPLEASGSVFVVFGRNAAAVDSAVALSRDGQALCALGGRAAQIVVTKAVYGVPGDPARNCDVRAKVQRKVDQGNRQLLVSEMGSGKDPAPGAVKTLAVEYVIDNRQFFVHAADGQDDHPQRRCGQGDDRQGPLRRPRRSETDPRRSREGPAMGRRGRERLPSGSPGGGRRPGLRRRQNGRHRLHDRRPTPAGHGERHGEHLPRRGGAFAACGRVGLRRRRRAATGRLDARPLRGEAGVRADAVDRRAAAAGGAGDCRAVGSELPAQRRPDKAAGLRPPGLLDRAAGAGSEVFQRHGDLPDHLPGLA